MSAALLRNPVARSDQANGERAAETLGAQRVAGALGGNPVGSGSFCKRKERRRLALALSLPCRLQLAAAVDVDVPICAR